MSKRLVERLRKKLSPLEDSEFTDKIKPRLGEADFSPFVRSFKGVECVVLSPREAHRLLLDNADPDLHELTLMGRSLQALLWERSYLKGILVFTKTLQEIEDDGF